MKYKNHFFVGVKMSSNHRTSKLCPDFRIAVNRVLCPFSPFWTRAFIALSLCCTNHSMAWKGQIICLFGSHSFRLKGTVLKGILLRTYTQGDSCTPEPDLGIEFWTLNSCCNGWIFWGWVCVAYERERVECCSQPPRWPPVILVS